MMSHCDLESNALLLTALFILLACIFNTSESSINIIQYQSDNATLFQQIVFDHQTRTIVVAGENLMYRLGTDLVVRNFVRHGPINDVVNCRSSGACNETSPSNNQAKLLEIEPKSGRLLFCGSARRGLCTLYSLEDLEQREDLDATNRLSYLGGNGNVVGFFSDDSEGRHATLYVGNTYDGRPLDDTQQTISALKLSHSSGKYRFDYTHVNAFDSSVHSAIDVDNEYKASYVIDYIAAFEHGGFSYYVTVQRENTVPSSNYVTKLARVCQRDSGFYSYTEVLLSCRKKNSLATFYNLARAAFVGKVGEEFARKFNILSDEDVLYVTFGRGDAGSSSPSAAYGSGMCMYSLQDLRRKYTKVQQDCYSGRGRILPWIDHYTPKCRFNVSIQTKIHCINE